MVTLLEFIFQGFFEWVYSLILDIWNYFTSSLLGVMSLDFAYLKTHIPIMGDIQQILLAVGWALLLGNLVFQALRSMVSGLGFEGEDPKLLFARTFAFGFLLLASPQICETVLGMTSKVIVLLEVPDTINVQLVDGSVIGVFTASWILVIIFDLITMFMVLSLLLEVAERYMVLAMLTITAPPLPWAAARAHRRFSPAGVGCLAACVCSWPPISSFSKCCSQWCPPSPVFRMYSCGWCSSSAL